MEVAVFEKPYRKTRGNQQTIGRKWHETDVKLLKPMAGTTRPKLIAKLLDRSYESIRQTASREGIRLRCTRYRA